MRRLRRAADVPRLRANALPHVRDAGDLSRPPLLGRRGGRPGRDCQLDAIVDNIAKVSQVATPDVVATSHPIPLENVFRPDTVGEVLTTAQALQNAPDAAGDRFRVTAILGEEQ
ncbi:Asp-tRNA(Asn)/Glu-tRNA(Gln) amidotransferase subunit GatC [Ralstonia pickettii]|nr:Asp-tRNA(Asn)/Glu-tRNA(Gln) amidotransferase subunit GatC [Ralstonia pickettii]